MNNAGGGKMFLVRVCVSCKNVFGMTEAAGGPVADVVFEGGIAQHFCSCGGRTKSTMVPAPDEATILAAWAAQTQLQLVEPDDDGKNKTWRASDVSTNLSYVRKRDGYVKRVGRAWRGSALGSRLSAMFLRFLWWKNQC